MRSGTRLLAATVCLVAVAAFAACGRSGPAGSSQHASATPLAADAGHGNASPGAGAGQAGGAAGSGGGAAPSSGATAGGGGTPGSAAAPGKPQPTKRAGVREVADPQEAESFPVPADTQHASAATPAKAGELAVAAGAPSDAEVKRELEQMQALERAAKQSQRSESNLPVVPGGRSIGGGGALPIPSGAPEVVQRVIAGANEIADFPYVYGGGHASFVDNAYDCSGSVSYALAAGGLLPAPETSGELESWGVAGPGRFITVYANAGHAYMYVDGVMFNTAGRSGPYASRWQVGALTNSGFVARHWPGL